MVPNISSKDDRQLVIAPGIRRHENLSSSCLDPLLPAEIAPLFSEICNLWLEGVIFMGSILHELMLFTYEVDSMAVSYRIALKFIQFVIYLMNVGRSWMKSHNS